MSLDFIEQALGSHQNFERRSSLMPDTREYKSSEVKTPPRSGMMELELNPEVTEKPRKTHGANSSFHLCLFPSWTTRFVSLWILGSILLPTQLLHSLPSPHWLSLITHFFLSLNNFSFSKSMVTLQSSHC